jgi:hypothetical protein
MKRSSEMSFEVANLVIGVNGFVEILGTIVTFEFQSAFVDNEFKAVLGEFLLYPFGGIDKPGVLIKLYGVRATF